MKWSYAILAGVALLLGPWGLWGSDKPSVGGDGASGWQAAVPDFAWEFPRDHWSHSGYQTEWWYFTGHLETAGSPGRRFGYQLTFFRVGLFPDVPDFDSEWAANDLVMAHFAVGDAANRKHWFRDVLYRETSFLGGFGTYPDSLVAWCAGPPGTDSRWTLRYNGEAFDFRLEDREQGLGLELTTAPAKPWIFQGPNGYSKKGREPDAASQYYSFTRLRSSGTLMVEGTTYEVSGSSWMDREFGSNQLSPGQVGWDWFSLQLDDGRELMLYVLRAADGAADFFRGTLVSAEGDARYLGAEDWSYRQLETWTSPRTKATYPVDWTLELPREGLSLRVTPLFPEQENIGLRSGGIHYWEGAVEVRNAEGTAVGRGYVELTGYGEGSRPPI